MGQENSYRWVTILLLIGLVWYIGFRMTLSPDSTRLPMIASCEGPYPYGHTDDGPRRSFRSGEPLPVRTRIEIQPSTRLTLALGGDSTLEMADAADLTVASTDTLSLNEGLFTWTAAREKSPVEWRLKTPDAVVMSATTGLTQAQPARARIQVDEAHTRITVLEGVVVAAGKTLTKGSYQFNPSGMSESNPYNPPADAALQHSTLHGEIMDASGRLLTEASAALVRRGETPMQFTPVGLSGSFTAEAVEAGTYTLHVTEPRHIPSGVSIITVTSSDPLNVRINLRHGRQLLGYVGSFPEEKALLDAVIRARLVEEDRDLLAGEEAYFNNKDRVTQTQHQGIFVLEGLAPGARYDLEISAEGRARKRLRVSMGESTRITTILRPESAIRGIAIRLNGTPVPYAQAAVYDATGALAATRTCDNLGRFRIGSLPPGVYTVLGNRRGLDPRQNKTRPVSVELKEGEEVRNILINIIDPITTQELLEMGWEM